MESSDRTHRKVALFDICQTLVGVTTISDFTDQFLLSRKRNPDFRLGRHIAHRLCRVLYRFRLMSPRAYRAHLVALYAGYSEATLRPLAQAYADCLRAAFKGPILDKMRALARQGYEIYLVSAGLDAYLEPFARSLSAGLISTALEKTQDGIFTGRVLGVDCIGEGKVAKARSELPHFEEVDWAESYAFGDSVSDIPILSLVGHACAVDPESGLREVAREKGWDVWDTASGATIPA